MQTLKIEIDFDYSRDEQNFYPPDLLEKKGSLDLRDSKKVLYNCGWLKVWGKELSGIARGQNAGNAFLGNWLKKTSEKITFAPHPKTSALVPQRYSVFLVISESSPNKPIIVCIDIDGLTSTFLVHYKGAPGTDKLAGREESALLIYDGVEIPYPANEDYKQAGFPAPYHDRAFHKNTLAATVKMTLGGNKLVFGAGICNSDQHGRSENAIFVPLDPGQSIHLIDSLAETVMRKERNPNTGILYYLIKAEDEMVLPQLSVVQANPTGPTPTTYPKIPNLSLRKEWPFETAPQKKDGFTFEGFDLPRAPKGYTWALNVRGVLFLQDTSSKEFMWPDEVFDGEKVAKLLKEYPEGVNELEQYKRLVELFEYMEKVGSGISSSAKMYRELMQRICETSQK